MVHDSDMPRNTGKRGAPRQRPPAPEGFYRVDQVATLINAHDETVRGWIRDGRLEAERHMWRGRPYYLVTQAEVDRILQAGDRPFGAGALVGAGDRGSVSPSALILGALIGSVFAIVIVTHHGRDVLVGLGAYCAYFVLMTVFWALFMLPHTRKHARERRTSARSAP
jgi:excisionase family DNA binding protein